MDILETLGLSWQSILFHLINLAIIVVAAYFLLRKPLRKMVQKQNQELENVAGENKRLTAEAEESKHKIEAISAEAKDEAARIQKDAETKALAKSDSIVEEAEAKAANIIETARKEALAERERLFGDYEKRVAGLSVEIAEKILTRELSQKDNQKIIDECIKELIS